MSEIRLSALRFGHPDLDGAFTPGFSVDEGGALASASDHLAIRQSLLLLLSTMPGERVRRPDYGCDLHQLTFAPNDETTHGLAIHYVTQAVQRWDPRVRIVHVDASRDVYDSALMTITLSYVVRTSGAEETLQLNIPLNGEGG